MYIGITSSPSITTLVWRFPKLRVPSNHPKIDHSSIETNGFGIPQFKEPPYSIIIIGWWFQTFFIFPFHIWDNPSHWLSYFSRWLKPPTRLLLLLLWPLLFYVGTWNQKLPSRRHKAIRSNDTRSVAGLQLRGVNGGDDQKIDPGMGIECGAPS